MDESMDKQVLPELQGEEFKNVVSIKLEAVASGIEHGIKMGSTEVEDFLISQGILVPGQLQELRDKAREAKETEAAESFLRNIACLEVSHGFPKLEGEGRENKILDTIEEYKSLSEDSLLERIATATHMDVNELREEISRTKEELA